MIDVVSDLLLDYGKLRAVARQQHRRARESATKKSLSTKQYLISLDSSAPREVNFSTVFVGQAVGLNEVHDDIWLVSFMDLFGGTSI